MIEKLVYHLKQAISFKISKKSLNFKTRFGAENNYLAENTINSSSFYIINLHAHQKSRRWGCWEEVDVILIITVEPANPTHFLLEKLTLTWI